MEVVDRARVLISESAWRAVYSHAASIAEKRKAKATLEAIDRIAEGVARRVSLDPAHRPGLRGPELDRLIEKHLPATEGGDSE